MRPSSPASTSVYIVCTSDYPKTINQVSKLNPTDPPLDWRTSKEIWQVNLNRSKDRISADDATIIRFAKKHYHSSDDNTRWNGRQIYNAFKTAIALAQNEEKDGIDKKKKQSDQLSKPKLRPEHFRQVAHASRQFDKYLLETQGGESMTALNKQGRVRDDSFGLRDQPPRLKRRSTRTKQLDLSDLPSTSEESTDVSEDMSADLTEESEEERRSSKKKSSKKSKSSTSGKKREEKKPSAKKKSNQESSRSSDESS